jgi:hypothetical protein
MRFQAALLIRIVLNTDERWADSFSMYPKSLAGGTTMAGSTLLFFRSVL